MGELSDFTQNDSKYQRGILSMEGVSHGTWNFRTGSYRSDVGVVLVYLDDHSLMLTTAAKGRQYARHWKASFGDKTIARLCREFLEDRAA